MRPVRYLNHDVEFACFLVFLSANAICFLMTEMSVCSQWLTICSYVSPTLKSLYKDAKFIGHCSEADIGMKFSENLSVSEIMADVGITLLSSAKNRLCSFLVGDDMSLSAFWVLICPDCWTLVEASSLWDNFLFFTADYRSISLTCLYGVSNFALVGNIQ